MMILGTRWIKKTFEPDSRMTKAELVEDILAGNIPGWVKGGSIPYVDEDAWKMEAARPQATPASTGQKPSGAFLLT